MKTTCKQRERISSLIWLVVGILSLLVSFYIGKNHEVFNLYQGLGIGATCAGAASFISTNLRIKKLQHNDEIIENDERLHMLWDKAGNASYNVGFYAVVLLFILIPALELSSYTVCFSLMIIMPISNLVFTYYYNKKI